MIVQFADTDTGKKTRRCSPQKSGILCALTEISFKFFVLHFRQRQWHKWYFTLEISCNDVRALRKLPKRSEQSYVIRGSFFASAEIDCTLLSGMAFACLHNAAVTHISNYKSITWIWAHEKREKKGNYFAKENDICVLCVTCRRDYKICRRKEWSKKYAKNSSFAEKLSNISYLTPLWALRSLCTRLNCNTGPN